jgi:hypothetical protein
MQKLLTENPSNANAPHPRVRGTLLDSAINWGYLPEAQLLFQFGAKTNSGSPLAGAVMLANMDLVNWVYDNLDKNVNNTAVAGNIFASTQTTDLQKFTAFEFVMDRGADSKIYALNAVLLSPLATKYLVERDLLNLNASAGNNRTILDELELRNMTNPYTLYLKPDKTNEIFVAVTNSDMQTLNDTTNDVNMVLSNVVGTPYLYAMTLGKVDVARLLISKGANTAYATPSGRNAIFCAVQSNSLDAVNLAREGLPENAIDVVHKNKRGAEITVLQSGVVRCVNTELFTSLLKPYNNKKGANPNLLCDGVPPAGTIAYVLRAPDHPFNNHTDMFKALVNAGANVDTYVNIMRNTPRNLYLDILKSKGFSQEIIDSIANYKPQL